MDINKTKLELIEWILHLDEKGLTRILELKNEIENGIVAYTVTGKPLTLAQYRTKIEQGTNDIKEGKFIPHEDLLKDIENW
jgi:hypothetical protein